jgi:hypothetical protein
MQRAPLRVGVMTGGASVPRWVAEVLDDIDACSVAELVGFVLDPDYQPRPRAMERLRNGRSRLLYEFYCQLDARRFPGVVNPLDEIDVSDRLGRLSVLNIVSGASKVHTSRFDAETISTVASWDLDVILSFGGGVIPGAILDCARYGVWSYRHGDPDAYRGGPPLFWEIYDGAPVSGSALERLIQEPGPGEVIYRSFSATDPISLHRSRIRIYRKSAEFVVRKLREVHRNGGLSVLHQGDRTGPAAAVRRTPTNQQMLRFGCRVAARVVRQKTRKAVARQQWFLAYQRRRVGLPTTESLRTATMLVPPRDRFYADPCLVDWQGSAYLFFEEFGFAEQKGVVSCCRLTSDGRCTRPEIVLDRPYHLSYPFVFFVGEDAFMLPETAANGAIELYKAHSFPSGWALDSVLVSDVRAVDPTLIEHDGRYWLFANLAVEGASTNDELFLFSAKALRGPWEPHPRNPVISDVRRARPAGRPFIDDSGSLIRPSQDCSGFYGSAVVFSRIDELSETDYCEAPLGRLEPSWHASNLGTHTYTRSELWEALDGRAWMRRRPPSPPTLS